MVNWGNLGVGFSEVMKAVVGEEENYRATKRTASPIVPPHKSIQSRWSGWLEICLKGQFFGGEKQHHCISMWSLLPNNDRKLLSSPNCHTSLHVATLTHTNYPLPIYIVFCFVFLCGGAAKQSHECLTQAKGKQKIYIVCHSTLCQETVVSAWTQQQQFVAEAGRRWICCALLRSRFHNSVGMKVHLKQLSTLTQIWGCQPQWVQPLLPPDALTRHSENQHFTLAQGRT